MKTVYIKWGIIALVVIIVVGLSLSFMFNREEEVSISSANETSVVKVNFDDHVSLLSLEQRVKLQYNLIQSTTNKATSMPEISGTIRPSSIQRSSSGETTFIVDVPKLQTSYLISRYVSVKESVDIVNISCVPDEQKVYPKDYCYEE